MIGIDRTHRARSGTNVGLAGIVIDANPFGF